MIKKKEQQYPRHEARFIRIKDDSGFNVVKEGTVWMYWMPTRDRDASFRTVDFKFISARAMGELNDAILHGKIEASDKNDFEPYVSKKERDDTAKKAAEVVKSKLEEGKAGTATSPTPKPQPSPKKSKAASEYSGVPTPPTSTSVKKEKEKAAKPERARESVQQRFKKWIAPDYKSLTKSELDIIFLSAARWKKYSDKEAQDIYKQLYASDEFFAFIDDFVYEGLLRRGAVPDDQIPPMAILKKLETLNRDREMMVYYERRLNQGKAKREEAAKKSRIAKFKDGKTFDKSTLPVSLKVALALGSGAFKVASGAVSVAKSLSSLARSKDDSQEVDLKKASAGLEQQTVDPKRTGLAGFMDRLSPKGAPSLPSNAIAVPWEKTSKETNRSLKDILKALRDGLPGKSTTVAPKVVEGVDKDIAEKSPSSIPPTESVSPPKESDEKKGGLLGGLGGMLGGLFKILSSPFKMLAGLAKLLSKGFLGLLGIFGKIPMLGKLFSKLSGVLGSTIGSLIPKGMGGGAMGALKMGLRGAGAVGAIAASGMAGWEAGSYLNEKLGLSDKISDAFISKPEQSEESKAQLRQMKEARVQKMKDAGVPDAEIKAWVESSDPNLPPTYAKSLAEKRNAATAVTAADKHVTDVQVSVPEKSSRMERMDGANKDMDRAKKEVDQSQMVQAVTSKNTTVVQQSSGGSRMHPRTTNNVMQEFIRSRHIFA